MSKHYKSCSGLIAPGPYKLNIISPAPITSQPLHSNIYLNKLGPNVPNNIPRNTPLCYFDSFSIVLVTPFTN